MEVNSRIDKWLWSVRIFKTRAIAAEYCKKGRVFVNSNTVKPAKDIHVGDVIAVRRPPVTYSFCVKGFPKNRVGAKLAPEYVENITPPDELQKLNPDFMAFYGARDRGAGRPTKKERRSIEGILDEPSSDLDWDDEPND